MDLGHIHTLIPKVRELAKQLSWLAAISWKNGKHFRSEISSKIWSVAEKGDMLVSGRGRKLLETYFRHFIASH